MSFPWLTIWQLKHLPRVIALICLCGAPFFNLYLWAGDVKGTRGGVSTQLVSCPVAMTTTDANGQTSLERGITPVPQVGLSCSANTVNDHAYPDDPGATWDDSNPWSAGKSTDSKVLIALFPDLADMTTDQPLPTQQLIARNDQGQKSNSKTRQCRQRITGDYTIERRTNPSQPRQNHQLVLALPARFQCKLCRYTTHYKSGLDRHVQTHIPVDKRRKPFRCQQCNYASDRQASLNEHMRTHLPKEQRPKPWRCDLCNHATDCKSSLKKHKKIHRSCANQQQRLSCDSTDSASGQPGNQVIDALLPDSKSLKRFRCQHCNFKTHHRRSLNRHQWTHLSADQRKKPFQCDWCCYATDIKNNLQRHKKIHQSQAKSWSQSMGNPGKDPFAP